MYSSIAANKRNTIVIMAVFVLLVGLVGLGFGYYENSYTLSVIILIVAAIYALFQYFAASQLAVLATGAHEITKQENPRLWRIVENIAITDGLPMPKVYIIDDPAPNAFATGRDPNNSLVCATTGILEIMDDREMTAVMAHEMGHVKNYDIRVSMIAFGLVSAIGFITNIAMRMLWFGDDREDNNQNPIMLVAIIVVVILSPIIAALIQLAISRQREYLADATSVMTTRDPESMISALQKLQTGARPMQRQDHATSHLFFANPLKSGLMNNLFSTHPPLDQRIARIQKNEGRM